MFKTTTSISAAQLNTTEIKFQKNITAVHF